MRPARAWSLNVDARGFTLAVNEWGPTDAPPVLCLHGYLEQGAAWGRIARALPTRRVIAPDHRGHGQSDHVAGGSSYHFWDYVADVDALVRQLGGPVDLIGHSMGGTIAALFAGARPALVRRLVLVEGLGPPDDEPQAVNRARRFLDDRARPPTHRPLRDLDDATDRIQRGSGIARADAEALAERATTQRDDGLSWRWDAAHRARSPRPFSERQFAFFLAAIACPTLVIAGARSPYAAAADRARAIANHRVHIVANAGHLVHHDAPDELARVIDAHLSD